jgi:hypothetical protein
VLWGWCSPFIGARGGPESRQQEVISGLMAFKPLMAGGLIVFKVGWFMVGELEP